MSAPLRLFEGHGIELEYMLVDRRTLDVLPISDQLLRAQAGVLTGDVEVGPIAWSNELVLHVLELKTNGPAADLAGLPAAFGASLARVDELLAPLGACLLPGPMHPWMDPAREMRLWPHDNGEIYGAFDRIFDCRGHGWANLQSAHLNLPFGDDEGPQSEFGRLHAAIRLILPILPALAAGSPVHDGVLTGRADSRLEVYRHNARRVPLASGLVVPERAFSRREYERKILGPLYDAMAPHDPEGILRHEWCNARGAIARFDRNAIEIRVLDVQECPRADIAIAAAVTGAVRMLVEERAVALQEQQAWEVEPLAALLRACIDRGEAARIDARAYLALFGYPGGGATAGELWHHILGELALAWPRRMDPFLPALGTIVREGTLARRIVRALGGDTRRGKLHEVWSELARCLRAGELFVP